MEPRALLYEKADYIDIPLDGTFEEKNIDKIFNILSNEEERLAKAKTVLLYFTDHGSVNVNNNQFSTETNISPIFLLTLINDSLENNNINDRTCYFEISACHAGAFVKELKRDTNEVANELATKNLQNAKFIVSISISSRATVAEIDLRSEISRMNRKLLSPEEFFALSFLNGHQRGYLLVFEKGQIRSFNSPKYLHLNTQKTSENIYLKPFIDINDAKMMFEEMASLAITVNLAENKQVVIKVLSDTFTKALFGAESDKSANNIAETLGISQHREKLHSVITQALASGMKYNALLFLDAFFHLDNLDYVYELAHRINKDKQLNEKQATKEEYINALVSVLYFAYLSTRFANGLNNEGIEKAPDAITEFAKKLLIDAKKIHDEEKKKLLLEFGAICTFSEEKSVSEEAIKVLLASTVKVDLTVAMTSILYEAYLQKATITETNINQLCEFISSNVIDIYNSFDKRELLIVMLVEASGIECRKKLEKTLSFYELLLQTEGLDPKTLQLAMQSLMTATSKGWYKNNETYVFNENDVKIISHNEKGLKNDWKHTDISVQMSAGEFVCLFNTIDFISLSEALSRDIKNSEIKSLLTEVAERFQILASANNTLDFFQKISYNSLRGFMTFIRNPNILLTKQNLKTTIQENVNFLFTKQNPLHLENIANLNIHNGVFFACLQLLPDIGKISHEHLNQIFQARKPNIQDTTASQEYLGFIRMLDKSQIEAFSPESLANIFEHIGGLASQQVHALKPESIQAVAHLVRSLDNKVHFNLSTLCSFITYLTSKQLLAANSHSNPPTLVQKISDMIVVSLKKIIIL